MKGGFSIKFIAGSFIAAALMMWGGWMLIPIHVGPYMLEEDFGIVDDNRYLFVWSFRFYFFGVVFAVIALISMAAYLTPGTIRTVIWPGAIVAAGGAFSYALGGSYYYHHGYWGSLALQGADLAQIKDYISSIRMDGEYVTCLMRFGRVFSGLGILVFGVALVRWKPVPVWLGWMGVVAGFSAIAVVMPSGEAFHVYAPVFHLQSLWLALLGVTVLRKGVKLETGS